MHAPKKYIDTLTLNLRAFQGQNISKCVAITFKIQMKVSYTVSSNITSGGSRNFGGEFLLVVDPRCSGL